MLLDVRTDHLEIVQDILKKFVPECEVWAFGSRAKWLAKEYSDLDLCIVGETPLSFRTLGLLEEAFEDSDLPYKVDVVDWATTSESFRKIIERDKAVVQKAGRDWGLSSEWKTHTFGDLGTIKTGKTPPSSLGDAFGGTIPFVTPGDMYGQKWITDTDRYLNEKGLAAVSSSLMPARSVAVSCIGSDMGKAVLLSRPSVTNQQINSIAVDESRFNAEFVYYDLSARQQELKAAASGSATPILNKGHFSGFEISVPPRAIQDKIAEILGRLDDKIDLNRRINQTLEAMAQAIFKSWFVDFEPVKAKIAAIAEGRDPLRAAMSAVSGKPDAELDALPPEQYAQLAATAALFPDEMEESELGEIPRGWVPGSLSDFASFQNGYAFKTKDWTDSGHPVVKIGNVKPGIIDLSGCSFVANETVNGLDQFSLKRGDLLVGMTGYVGEMGLVPALDSVAYLNQRVGRISTANGVNDTGYPFCLVRDPAYKAYAESKAHGSAQANVSGKDLMDYQAVVPDTGVLNIFNAQAAKIISALLSSHEESQSLAALRDTLLPKLLSGELSVTETMAEADA